MQAFLEQLHLPLKHSVPIPLYPFTHAIIKTTLFHIHTLKHFKLQFSLIFHVIIKAIPLLIAADTFVRQFFKYPTLGE